MTPFRPARRPRERPDPHLDVKLVLFVVGAAFGAAGMITNRGVLLYIGIAILAAGLLLRFRRRAEAESAAGARDEEEDGGEAEAGGEAEEGGGAEAGSGESRPPGTDRDAPRPGGEDGPPDKHRPPGGGP